MADINDFIDPKLITSLEKINEELKESAQIIDQQVVPAIKKLEESQKKLGKNNDDNATKRKKLTADQKEAVRIAKQLETTQAKINGLRTEAGKKLTEQKDKLQKLTAAQKEALKISKAAEGSLVRMRKKLKELTAAYDSTGKRTKAAAAEINKLSKQIEKAEKATNRHGRGVGNYGGAIKKAAFQLAGALGLTSALFVFINVLKGAFTTIRQFTKENAVLAGVLGVTRKEVKSLTDQAIQLGAVYPVTASEVVKLQVSFARLGFTMEEISNLTEATIQGSIALNASLDQTATLVGAVVKAFDEFGTQDAGHIIDVLTLATQKSSQSFITLGTALPKVAAAANAMGISLETVVDQLGIAQDATLDASISGTSLRNIYLELSKTGKTLDEALAEINGSSNRLRTSFELFGKRAAIVGLALAKNAGNATEFNKALVDVGGTSDRVAKEQMATLDGAIKSLDSSWEKFILGMRNSEGFLRGFILGLADTLDTVSDEFISFGEKLVIIFGGVAGAQARATQIANRILLNHIKTATEEEINLILSKNIFLANEGDKFAQKVIDQAAERLTSIAKEEEDARAREELAIQTAELQQIAINAEAEEEITKNNEKESKKRIATWERETLARADEKQRQIDDQKELEESFAEEIAEDAAEGDKQAAKDADNSLKNSSNLIEQTKSLKEQEAQEEEDARTQTKQAAIDSAFDLGNTLFDLKTASLQREFEAAEGNEKKQAEISKKIAQQEKKKALFKIAVNTASAIVEALPNIPLSIIVGGLGLLQGGIVAAKPIPQFSSGITNFRGGVAELAEKGEELVKESSGKIWMAENRGLYNLSQGSTVLTAQQTQKELNDKNIVNGLRDVKKAIQRQPRQRQRSAFDNRRDGYWDGYNSRRLN